MVATQEQLRIPDLPPSTGDFNSLLQGLVEDPNDPLFEARINPDPRGFVRVQRSDRAFGNYYETAPGGELRTFATPGQNALRETRRLTDEQRDVLNTIRTTTLTAAQKNLNARSSDSFLEDILTGETDLLEARVNPDPRGFVRVQRSGRPLGNYYETAPGGELITSAGPGPNTLRETRRVTDEQRETLLSVADFLEKTKQPLQSVKSTASFLTDVMDNELSPVILLARVNPDVRGYVRVQRSGRPLGNYYETAPGGELRTFATPGQNALRETRRVTDEQKTVIAYIGQKIADRNTKIPTRGITFVGGEVVTKSRDRTAIDKLTGEVGLDDTSQAEIQALVEARGLVADPSIDDLVFGLFETGDEGSLLDALEDRRVALADLSNTGAMQGDITNLETYIQVARRISLRGKFWKAIADGSPDQAIALADGFATNDDADRLLALDLRKEALDQTRTQLLVATYQEIASDEPNFDATLANLSRIQAITARDQDLEALGILETTAKQVFNTEINNLFGGLVKDFSLDRGTLAEISSRLEAAPVRPAIAGVDYFEAFSSTRETFAQLSDKVEAIAVQKEVADISMRIGEDANVQGLIEDILDIPGMDEEDSMLRQMLLDQLAFEVTARKGLNPGRFALLKSIAFEDLRKGAMPELTLDLTARPENRNLAALRGITGRFKQSLQPLFEAIRGGTSGDRFAEDYIAGGDGPRSRDRYVQKISLLEQQRELTDIEEAYLKSVELLSIFNPHMVALARERPELTSVYLEDYFLRKSAETKEALRNGAYIPAIYVGLGPNGLAGLGSLTQCNPELAANTLVIDNAELPGGPFGEAKGPSWELNSANSLGTTTNVLPDLSDADREGKSVRSYGSPLAFNPGERNEGQDIRAGSINVTVDYMINPDNVSQGRYPTNVDLARVLQLQTALLTDKVALSTELLDWEDVDDGLPGNKIAYLAVTDKKTGDTNIVPVRTDYIISSPGLGEANLGIDLDAPNTKEVIEANDSNVDGFPLLTDTIGAFKLLSDPEGEQVAPEGVVVLYGGGNSKDVLAEYLGRQFEGGNPALNKITKVVVVTQAPDSDRPRYSGLNDLKARNGQPNFLEFVDARVGSVELQKDGRVKFLDDNGQPIIAGVNGSRGELIGDHGLSAAGFKRRALDKKRQLKKVRLPNNPGFGIANTVEDDDDVLILGVGSEADFQNPNKLAQLPPRARAALLRNGAENAVAIGFRTPDTRAAVRLRFTGVEVPVPTNLRVVPAEKHIDVDDTIGKTTIRQEISEVAPTRRTVTADSDALTSLLLGQLAGTKLSRGGEVLGPKDEGANAQYAFAVTLDGNEVVTRSEQAVPRALMEAVTAAVRTPFFASYARKAVANRRGNRGLQVQLSFSNGRLRLRDSAEDQTDQKRTFVEAA